MDQEHRVRTTDLQIRSLCLSLYAASRWLVYILNMAASTISKGLPEGVYQVKVSQIIDPASFYVIDPPGPSPGRSRVQAMEKTLSRLYQGAKRSVLSTDVCDFRLQNKLVMSISQSWMPDAYEFVTNLLNESEHTYVLPYQITVDRKIYGDIYVQTNGMHNSVASLLCEAGHAQSSHEDFQECTIH
uniref:Uncharacterized protein n=1 Tax=Timema cristinae TaxID=61476 RepID=A0A7R9GQF7_TIMCR|nr:unnamed protein product [Timema cristinae]